MKNKSIASFMATLLFSSIFSGFFIPQTKAYFEPYQKTFIVTAYYSPLPGQEYYVTGSLSGDKRLNGNGTNGADGTPVYAGMIAAPSTYAFGTRVSCPGYIDGEIHDRGGAIVKAGVRTNAHDRLDFWAGHGDEALKTALYWGKRTLTCTVYPPGYSEFQQYVSLPNAPKQYGAPKTVVKSAPNTTSVSYGIPSRYKNILSDLGYDPEDKGARIAFQIRHGIIDSPEESVAGNVGPQTKAKLESIAAEMAQQVPPQGLEQGDISGNVRTLQKQLAHLGYLNVDPTAIFGDKTKAALTQFQIDQGLIESVEHAAAGYLGPGTQEALKKIALEKYMISVEDKQLISLLNKDNLAAESLAKANSLTEDSSAEEESSDAYYEALEELSQEWIKDHSYEEENKNPAPELKLASVTDNKEIQSVKEKLTPLLNPFDEHLSLGSKGKDVATLQQLLKELGFFTGELLTDYFGPQTQQAVIDFQMEHNIVKTTASPGAGLVGPKTVMALNASFYQHQFSLPFEVSNVIRAPAIHPKDLEKLVPTQHASSNTPSQS